MPPAAATFTFPRTDARVESKLALTSWSEDRPSYAWRQWGDFAILVYHNILDRF